MKDYKTFLKLFMVSWKNLEGESNLFKWQFIIFYKLIYVIFAIGIGITNCIV